LNAQFIFFDTIGLYDSDPVRNEGQEPIILKNLTAVAKPLAAGFGETVSCVHVNDIGGESSLFREFLVGMRFNDFSRKISKYPRAM